MQKQLKKGELKRKKYKQSYTFSQNKSRRSHKGGAVTFNKILIKRFKGLRFKRKSIFLKKALKYFPSGHLLKYRKILKTRGKSYLGFNIKVSPNNIFCNINENRNGRINVIKSSSTGAFKLKTTKKRLNFNLKPFLSSFLKPIVKDKSVRFAKVMHVKVVAPQRLKVRILEMMQGGLLKRLFSKKQIVLDLPDRKVFNGCRPKKDLRHKNRVSLYEK